MHVSELVSEASLRTLFSDQDSMVGRSGGFSLVQAFDMDEKKESLRFILKPYWKIFTKADFVEVIVAADSPCSCKDLKKEMATLMVILGGLWVFTKLANLLTAQSYWRKVDSLLSDSVKMILLGSIPCSFLQANFRKSIKLEHLSARSALIQSSFVLLVLVEGWG